jgi:hypothetical protein
MRALLPSIQPNSRRRVANAAILVCHAGSFSDCGMSAPIRRIRPDCCARAASGQAAATPLRSDMNSRRLIQSPRRHGRPESGGKLRPIARAALRLTDNVNLSGACTGSSAGRAPRLRTMHRSGLDLGAGSGWLQARLSCRMHAHLAHISVTTQIHHD